MSTIGVVEYDMMTGHREVIRIFRHAKKNSKRVVTYLRQVAKQDKSSEHTYYLSEQ